MWDGVMIDITSQKNLENQLKIFATIDGLTNVSNRRYFLEQGTELLADSALADKPFSVGIVDIDHFKSVNDNYGHSCGDTVLAEMGKLLPIFLRTRGLSDAWVAKSLAFFLLAAPVQKQLRYLKTSKSG